MVGILISVLAGRAVGVTKDNITVEKKCDMLSKLAPNKTAAMSMAAKKNNFANHEITLLGLLFFFSRMNKPDTTIRIH